ncbi:MAG TPA: T9SS type A sorting domain-containing protein, partial [Flavobacterium sp.]
RDEQHLIIINYLLPWLKNQLMGDCSSGEAFDNLIVADPGITFQKNCMQCVPLGVENFVGDLILYPNPFKDIVVVEAGQKADANITFYDINGRRLFTETIHSGVVTGGKDLPSGNYLFTIIANGEVLKRGLITKE